MDQHSTVTSTDVDATAEHLNAGEEPTWVGVANPRRTRIWDVADLA